MTGGRTIQGHARIVVKIGSALLVDADGLRRGWLAGLCADLARRHGEGVEVVVVSSGAIALGRAVLGLGAGELRLDAAPAAAAVGQIELAGAWGAALRAHGLTAAQVLLTLTDTEGRDARRNYLNARDTLTQLIRRRTVPVVNENDTVATSEIRYGDNDRLAARAAAMVGADLLVLLSDIDGLYTAPPARDADAKHVPHVARITPEIEAMAGDAGSGLSRGGMKTKVEAARIATEAGAAMVIASGRVDDPLGAIDRGARATWFDAQGGRSARKVWIGGQLSIRGRVTVDDGAVRALLDGRSLLAVGARTVSGRFERGDAVEIADGSGRILAHGLVGYDADEARRIAGAQSEEIETRLGYRRPAALVHRDDLVMHVDMGVDA